ncbi:MAG: hypothetical protein ABRQ38_26655 [Candidatus Eremiobacterota bacterium]
MAKYRTIQCEFWEDIDMLDLSAEEKYFYIYLLTNPYVTQTGIYQLPLKIAEVQTGYTRETILRLMDKFIHYGKIRYNPQTHEVALKNWAKYNFNNSGNILKCINSEIMEIKDKTLIAFVYDNFEYYGQYIPFLSSLQASYKPLAGTLQAPAKESVNPLQDPMKKEKEIKKEIKKEKEEEIKKEIEEEISCSPTGEPEIIKPVSCEKETSRESIQEEAPSIPLTGDLGKEEGVKCTGRGGNGKTSKQLEIEFESEIWPLYPRKEGRKDSLKYYQSHRKKGITKESFLTAIENYCRKITLQKTELKFILLGSTFFNGRFEDYINGIPDEEKIKHDAMSSYERAACRDPDDILKNFYGKFSNPEIIDTEEYSVKEIG